MPSGVYLRTEKHFKVLRQNIKVAHKKPRTKEQLKAVKKNIQKALKVAHKLLRTKKQIEASKKNGKKVGNLTKKTCKTKVRKNSPKGISRPHLVGCKCPFCNPPKGKDHCNWLGGKSEYSFDFNYKIKEKIRKRDNYICQNCGMLEKEHLEIYGRVLTIHHINYDKLDCKESNLISTCFKCNTKANFNRDYWKEYFQNKMRGILNVMS